MLALDDVEAADSGADVDSNALGNFGGDLQARSFIASSAAARAK